MNTILKIDHLNKSYHDMKSTILAVEDVTLDIKEKEFVSIVGLSGCGKSTILSILSNLEKKSGGNITFNKENCKLG